MRFGRPNGQQGYSDLNTNDLQGLGRRGKRSLDALRILCVVQFAVPVAVISLQSIQAATSYRSVQTKSIPESRLSVSTILGGHGPNDPHCRRRSYTTHHQHLQGTLEAKPGVLPSLPALHHARLHPSEGKEGEAHDSATHPEGEQDIIPMDAEIGHQRYKAAEEVTDADGRTRDQSAMVGGRRELMMEAHDEVVQLRGRIVQSFGDGGDG